MPTTTANSSTNNTNTNGTANSQNWVIIELKKILIRQKDPVIVRILIAIYLM
jgi:hypothetical protein